GGAGDVRARPVGLNLNSSPTGADGNSFDLTAIGDPNHLEVGRAQRGDEGQRAIRSELQTIGALHVGAERGSGLGCDIDGGDRSVLRVRRPYSFPVWRHIEAFDSAAGGHGRRAPIRART